MMAEASWATWATLASSVAAVLTAVATLVAFIFLRHQQQQTERQINGATSRYMYEEMSKLLGIFLDKPELRPFIYDGKPIDDGMSAEQKQQVLALAGLYADFFEQLLYQRTFGNLSVEEYESTWSEFIQTLLSASVVLREFAIANSSLYSPQFVTLVAECAPSLTEATDSKTSLGEVLDTANPSEHSNLSERRPKSGPC
jgi:hypothetical protein